MAKFKIQIDSILEGIAPNFYLGSKGQFSSSLGIDPDLPLSGANDIKTSGILRPSAYSDFTSTGLSGLPLWIITNPKNSNIYVYAGDGEFISYSSSFGSETVIGTPTNGAGQGAAYYNNYIYLATTTDIARYGPLDGTPALTNGVWTGATLGTQTALGNPTYDALYGAVARPNHPMHVHVDNKLYVGDFSTATEDNKGRGLIHWIRTTRNTAEEGTNNDGTTRSAFVLPFGYAPTAISSWGTDLVVAAIPMSAAGFDTTIAQGKAKLFFWDAINAPSLPYKVVELPDPTVTALLNHNGDLFIWSGNLNNGVRVSQYLGGYKLKQLAFFEEGKSPLPGAVDGLGNRIAWGASITYPEAAVCVYSLGYKDANLPLALHNIINTSATRSDAEDMVGALKNVQHASFIAPRFIVGWSSTSATDFGIDNSGSTADVAVWRSLFYSPGAPFKINKVVLQFSTPVAASMTLIPQIRVDDESTNTALTTINNTNYAGSERRAVFYPQVTGKNNFCLQLRWTGTALLPVTLPIIIEGETLEDATQ